MGGTDGAGGVGEGISPGLGLGKAITSLGAHIKQFGVQAPPQSG